MTSSRLIFGVCAALLLTTLQASAERFLDSRQDEPADDSELPAMNPLRHDGTSADVQLIGSVDEVQDAIEAEAGFPIEENRKVVEKPVKARQIEEVREESIPEAGTEKADPKNPKMTGSYNVLTGNVESGAALVQVATSDDDADMDEDMDDSEVADESEDEDSADDTAESESDDADEDSVEEAEQDGDSSDEQDEDSVESDDMSEQEAEAEDRREMGEDGSDDTTEQSEEDMEGLDDDVAELVQDSNEESEEQVEAQQQWEDDDDDGEY